MALSKKENSLLKKEQALKSTKIKLENLSHHKHDHTVESKLPHVSDHNAGEALPYLKTFKLTKAEPSLLADL